MKIKNSKGLPDVIVKAIEAMIRPPSHDSIHVTTLIQPPIIYQLRKRHWHDLEEDVVDNTWRLLGSAIHKVIESVSDTRISEQPIEAFFEGTRVRGTADVQDGSELYDYKVTSTWHKVFADGLPDDWVKQLNVYAFLFGVIKTAKVIVIYRDWQRSRALKDPDYPQEPLMAYNVPLAPKEDQLKYITERVKLHIEAETLADDALPICSPEDRWDRPTQYRVEEKGKARAIRVFDKEEDATKYVSVNLKGRKNIMIVKKLGESVRCNSYCSCNKFCRFYKQLLNNKEHEQTS